MQIYQVCATSLSYLSMALHYLAIGVRYYWIFWVEVVKWISNAYDTSDLNVRLKHKHKKVLLPNMAEICSFRDSDVSLCIIISCRMRHYHDRRHYMLVLSRKLSESVWLTMKSSDGSEKKVLVKVIDIGSRKVRLGFETDQDVTILRDELVNGKKKGESPPTQTLATVVE